MGCVISPNRRWSLKIAVMSHARLVSDARERDTLFDRENVKRLIDSLSLDAPPERGLLESFRD